MNGAKISLAALYETKIAGTSENIRRDRREYRRILEKSGFTVRQDERPARLEAAQNLIAEKGGVVLEVSQLLRGGKTFSVTASDGSRIRIVVTQTLGGDDATGAASRVTVDGVAQHESGIRLVDDQHEHLVEVTLRSLG